MGLYKPEQWLGRERAQVQRLVFQCVLGPVREKMGTRLRRASVGIGCQAKSAFDSMHIHSKYI